MTLSMSSTLSTNSTLVETVSINYEDFNESFLTCGTCLCMYDGGEHTPKLLPCSHTVCLHCLSRIAASQTRETGTLRCPICREQITIPRGGVAALPPSFLVNQLLDLMSRQRRHIIPKCSTHNSQELLFCETCDTVFCLQCTGGSNHSSTSGDSEHTIIPFSIAIKRMSEILLYKANECVSKVRKVCTMCRNVWREKTAVSLTDLVLKLFPTHTFRLSERERWRQHDSEYEFDSQHQLNFSGNHGASMTLSMSSTLSTNSTLVETVSINYEDFNESFLTCGTCLCMYDGGEHTPKLLPCSHTVCLHCLSRIAASQTRETGTLRCPICREQITIPRGGVAALPPSFLVNQLLDLMSRQRRHIIPKCSTHNSQIKKLQECIVNLEATATSWFPSFSCKLTKPLLSYCSTEECIVNLEATATVTTVDYHGNGRTSGGDPMTIELTKEGEPDLKLEPPRIVDMNDGEYKIKFRPTSCGRHCLKVSVLERPIRDSPLYFDVLEHNNPVDSYGARGGGREEFQQPVAVAVDSDNNLVGKKGSTPGCFSLMSSITVGAGGEIIIADSRIQVFNGKGDFMLEFPQDAKGKGKYGGIAVDEQGPSKGKYGGIAVDEQGLIVASRSEGSRHYVQVFRLSDGALVNTIDSYGARLRRPTGVATGSDGHCYVIDLLPWQRAYLRGRSYDHRTHQGGRAGPQAGTTMPGSDYQRLLETYGLHTVRLMKLESSHDLCVFLEVYQYSHQSGLSCLSQTQLKELTFRLSDRPNGERVWLALETQSNLCGRFRFISRITSEGDTVSSFTHDDFIEPTDVAVDPTYGHILIADNGPACVFVFDTRGKLLFQVGKKGSTPGCFSLMSSITVGAGGEIIIADSRIQVFNGKGDFMLEFPQDAKGKGKYGGIAVDEQGLIVASRSEGSRHYVQVFRLSDGALVNTIDSYGARLRRPTGVATGSDGHCYVIDLGNHCVCKYRYW
ncbi:uncharacterized protein LOC103516770 [Diaphorina citri]|uniref:Uncharacterized protein LOC103516770 n=1 Tax=Diaphorina citri TaxID=121845 RepID=A0A3Q0J8R2_DIACI|nr:uncharacterized protein LOC103516770 [Diaphorina citri]